ncbi:aldo/keto reductase family protein [Gregarina niphandrodes]|uniref:Aldo/keto reductase family protein n=1 Tax=Gregarina niphandrodes TaxID=110365 RepID=A0A023B3D7_GRENI|nr:aldo/keto reductase family protein [Gregarina niphandrodes]EZG55508.1 aldo/keto reductase family protein [Gregarina niphandrodes]|eukprot:XP_011131528.1 aldo/keto reductase family protein [Gregarina niphandrodes]
MIWCTNFTPEGIRAQVDQHLKDFKRSSIDLLLLHFPGNHYLWAKDENSVRDPRNAETRIICWKTLEALYAEGKVRLIGVSNYMAKHLQPLIQDIEKRKAAGDKHARLPFVNQIEISAFCQVGDELEQLCKQNDIIFTSYSSLGSAKCVAENIAHEVIQSIATKHKVTAANVLLRWCLQKGYMILPRSTKAERVKENYGPTMSFKLDQEDMEAISKLNTGRRAVLDPHDIA